MSDSNPFNQSSKRGQNAGTWATPSQLTAGPFPLQAPFTIPQTRLNMLGASEQAPPASTFVSTPTYSSTHSSPLQQIDMGSQAPATSTPVFFIPVQASSNMYMSQAEPMTQTTNLAFTGQIPASFAMSTPQFQFSASQDSTLPTPLFRRTALSQIQAQNLVTDSMRSSSLPPYGSKLAPFTGAYKARSLEQRALVAIKLQQACQAWNERGTAGCSGNCFKAHICKKCLEWLGETEQHPACECDNGGVLDKDARPEKALKRARRSSSLLATQMEVDTPLDAEHASSTSPVAEDQPCVEWNLGLAHSNNCRALHACRECFNLKKPFAEHKEKDCFYYHRRIQGMDVN